MPFKRSPARTVQLLFVAACALFLNGADVAAGEIEIPGLSSAIDEAPLGRSEFEQFLTIALPDDPAKVAELMDVWSKTYGGIESGTSPSAAGEVPIVVAVREIVKRADLFVERDVRFGPDVAAALPEEIRPLWLDRWHTAHRRVWLEAVANAGVLRENYRRVTDTTEEILELARHEPTVRDALIAAEQAIDVAVVRLERNWPRARKRLAELMVRLQAGEFKGVPPAEWQEMSRGEYDTLLALMKDAWESVRRLEAAFPEERRREVGVRCQRTLTPELKLSEVVPNVLMAQRAMNLKQELASAVPGIADFEKSYAEERGRLSAEYYEAVRSAWDRLFAKRDRNAAGDPGIALLVANHAAGLRSNERVHILKLKDLLADANLEQSPAMRLALAWAESTR